MIYYKCDNCLKDWMGPLPIELTGFSRAMDGKLLLPYEPCKHFCSRVCFIAWMREELNRKLFEETA